MDSQAPDFRDGMDVAEGAEPTVAGENPAAPRLAQSVDPAANIVLRLWRVELDIGAVEKAQTATIKGEGGQTQYTYKFTGYDAVVAAVRPALAKHGVKVMPTKGQHERTGNLSVVTMGVDFINVDNPSDRLSVEMTNYGADKGDKGASKALTNVMREAIKKGLGITSVEDDRADEVTEFESTEGVSRKELDNAHEGKRAALEQWARTFKAALENAQSLPDLRRLTRENHDQLTDEALPAVTRSFFGDLIGKRTKEFEARGRAAAVTGGGAGTLQEGSAGLAGDEDHSEDAR